MRPQSLLAALRGIGLDRQRLASAAADVVPYWRRRSEFLRAAAGQRDFGIGPSRPCLGDARREAGSTDTHYFSQDLHVAQLVHARNPGHHVDVGSRIDGFVAHVASFRPIEVLDIRPLEVTIRNITFRQRDITMPDPSMDDMTDSLSSLHAIEHVGLGRYGDVLNYHGHLAALDNLVRMLKSGGRLYISLPISSRQRIEYDAHRVFSIPYLLNTMFADRLNLMEFAFIDDLGRLHVDVDIHEGRETSFNLDYGCGIFVLEKPIP